MVRETVTVNRAPVLTLWAAVVAERLGFKPDEALSLGKALAGLNAQAKGRSLGLFKPPLGPDGAPAPKRGLGEAFWVPLCGRSVPAKTTPDGIRAVVREQPVDPGKVQRYLQSKFGEDLGRTRQAMTQLASGLEPEHLAEAAYGLYERFRPRIDRGRSGWGQKGELDLSLIRSLAPKA